MTNEPPSNPAFAFAIYASTAATAAIVALRDANLIDGDEIKKLAENLTICRLVAGSEPRLIEHAELLLDMLLPGSRS